MNWRRPLMMSASAACCALATVATTAGSAASAATTATATSARPADTQPPAGHLGAAMPVPGLAALNVDKTAEVSLVRCASPGFCTAVGDYRDARNIEQAFVVNETDFTWGTATPVPGMAALANGRLNEINTLDCPTAGNCTLGGFYTGANDNSQGFIDQSTNGVFGNAFQLLPANNQTTGIADVVALSCSTPGDCTAAVEGPPVRGAGPDAISVAFLITETNGRWGPLRPVPGIPGNDTTVNTFKRGGGQLRRGRPGVHRLR